MVRFEERQLDDALDLCRDARVNLSDGGTMDEVNEFQFFFGKKYQIVVYEEDMDTCGLMNVIYSGPFYSDRKLLLYYHDHHFDVIINIKGFIQKCFLWTMFSGIR